MTQAIHIAPLNKTYGRGNKAQMALSNIGLEVASGEMVALIGASGSDKSTLLRHIAGLVPGDSNKGAGLIEVHGRRVQSNGRIHHRRRQHRTDTSMIFQQFNLAARLSVLTNVCLDLLGRISDWRGSISLFSKAEKMAAMKALDRVGMARFAAQRAPHAVGRATTACRDCPHPRAVGVRTSGAFDVSPYG